MQPRLSRNVRLYFPGLMEEILHPFVSCTNCIEPVVEDYPDFFKSGPLCVFPFPECFGLLRQEEPNSVPLNKHLEILAESVLPLNKSNVIPNLVFWKITTLHSTTKRVVCVYGSPTQHGYDYSPQSLCGKNVNKLKEILLGLVENIPNSK
jgi:hypothetical protein